MGIAQTQANYMASSGDVSHTRPDGSRPYQRALAAGYAIEGGYPPYFFSENIISTGGNMSPADAVQAWTGDDAHLNTMTSDMLQEIGAGVAVSGGNVYYVIDCARPKTSGPPAGYTPGAESVFNLANEIIEPVTKSTPNTGGDVIHEVKSGQSLWQIAIEYGVKIDEIRLLNQLPTAYLINPGDTLLIQKLGTATPAPPTQTPAATSTSTPNGPPTPTSSATGTPSPTPAAFGGLEGGGTGVAVAGIIAAALAAAGLMAWASRTRPH
jgi:LysM repeat protein